MPFDEWLMNLYKGSDAFVSQSLVDLIRIKTCIVSYQYTWFIAYLLTVRWTGLDCIRLDWTGQLADCKLQL